MPYTINTFTIYPRLTLRFLSFFIQLKILEIYFYVMFVNACNAQVTEGIFFPTFLSLNFSYVHNSYFKTNKHIIVQYSQISNLTSTYQTILANHNIPYELVQHVICSCSLTTRMTKFRVLLFYFYLVSYFYISSLLILPSGMSTVLSLNSPTSRSRCRV